MAKETTKTPWDIIRDAQEIIKTQSDALIGDLQKQLQKVADTVKTIDQITGKQVLKDPAFEQALDELGVELKDAAKPKKVAKELPSIVGSPFSTKLIEIVRNNGKPIDAAGVIAKVGTEAKATTTKNYLARLVAEGVLYRPSRGLFGIK